MVNNKEINMVKLGDILSTSFTNGVYKSSNHYGTGVSILRITDFDNDGYLITDDLQQVELSDAEVSNYKLQPKDIVVNRVNSLTHIGKSILWMDTKNEVTVYESNMMRIKPKESVVLPEYLIKILHSDSARNHYKRVAKRAIGQSSINQQDVKSLLFFLPPLPEQQKIAKILTTWDKAIDSTERLIDNSKQQKKALMQQLLTGKKRLLDENGRRFEDEWKSQLFKKTLKLDRGSSPRPIVNYTTESEDGVNWIKIGDTKGDGLYINSTKEKITPEGAKKSRKVSKGEIILSNSMSYGKPYILNIDGYIHDGWFVIRDYEKHLDKSYLIQILSSELIQMQYKRLAAGGVVSNISSELVYSVKIDIPSIPEQQKIATVLTNADKEIELLEQQLADLQQEKKALMQVLLTGKKRVVVDIDG
ncbi:restriction endonuclease subunit S [Psychrobacter celer]|uniref:restriction endonuclease subunit S n=1 Tax=Psychrobacter celer TaxID=306572 RepID=UPI002FE4F903